MKTKMTISYKMQHTDLQRFQNGLVMYKVTVNEQQIHWKYNYRSVTFCAHFPCHEVGSSEPLWTDPGIKNELERAS